MKKSLIFVLCVFTLLFTLVIFGASADEAPTPVSTAAEFKAMTTGGNYILTADIDFGGEAFSKYIFSEFHGTIDGNGKTLKNFSIVGGTDGYNAMIANANGFLYIKDLNVGTADAPISVTGAQKASSGSAVLVGFGNAQYNCIISNVNIYGNINIEDNYKAMTAGFFAQSKNVLIENSTFNGTIKVGKTDVLYDQYRNVAGFIGSCTGSAVVIKNCTNNANITLAPATKEARAAGFVGYTDRMINLIGCTNNGNITVLDLGETKSGTQLGGIVAHTNHYASVFDNCKNNGTLTASSGLGQIVGKATAGAYLVGGTSGTNAYGVIDYAADKGSFVYVEGDYTDYIDVATAEQFLAMQSGKKYRLTADIDLGGVTFEDSVIKGDFSGVIDGQGHKVYNFNIKHVSGDTAIITRTAERVPFVLKNITFGTSENLIKVDSDPKSGKSQAVVLSGVHTNGTTYMTDVNVYADFTTVGIGQKYAAAGIVAYTRHITFDNCNYYGKITVGDFVTNKGNTVWRNAGAICGTVQGISYAYNCTNYADLTVGNGTGEVRLGGIIGYAGYPYYIEGCNNRGKISVVTNDTTITSSKVHVAGIICESNRDAVTSGSSTTYYYACGIINNCNNYGEIVSDDVVAVPYQSAILGRIRVVNPTIINCGNHVVPVGANAGELVGKKDSGSFTAINFTDAASQPTPPVEPEIPTPPTSDMSIVYVAVIAMVALASSAVIVYRKRRSLSK